MIENSYDLYRLLEKQDLLKSSPSSWWPSYGTFEVVVGSILTQNSQWKRVEISLHNLRSNNLLDIESLSNVDIHKLEELIQPSGLFKSKAKYLKELSRAIKYEFADFKSFCMDVERGWLLKQKGIGPETADSILCYACKKDVMVVDAYTSRLLNAFGYEFERYDDLQQWCKEGLLPHFKEDELFTAYAFFHGMIVEFVKYNSKNKKVNIEGLK